MIGPLLETPLQERFWSNVDTSGGADACWPWTACRRRKGYGAFTVASRLMVASRLAWMSHHKEEIPEGLFVLHSCHNPPCCNPAHLRVGTAKENTQEMIDAGRTNYQFGGGLSIRGAAHTRPMAKVTEIDIQQIRFLYGTGKYLQREIADMFGLVQSNISRIINGKAWDWVDLTQGAAERGSDVKAKRGDRS